MKNRGSIYGYRDPKRKNRWVYTGSTQDGNHERRDKEYANSNSSRLHKWLKTFPVKDRPKAIHICFVTRRKRESRKKWVIRLYQRETWYMIRYKTFVKDGGFNVSRAFPIDYSAMGKIGGGNKAASKALKKWHRENSEENKRNSKKGWEVGKKGFYKWRKLHPRKANVICSNAGKIGGKVTGQKYKDDPTLGKRLYRKREKIKRRCDCCKKKYTARQFSRFCSNNCKSYWRGMSRIDSITIYCKWCNTSFRKNKYSKTKFCSKSCAVTSIWESGTRKAA